MSLTQRLAVAMSGIALLAALLAGVLTAPLLSSATEDATREPLGRQATLLAQLPVAAVLSQRGQRLGARAELTVGIVTPSGAVVGAATVLTRAQVATLLSGGSVSGSGRLAGASVLVEARPARTGGAVVLTADDSIVDDSVARVRRRVLLAILVGLVAALGTAWVLAARLGRPLAETASAARRLAAGERGVHLPRTTSPEIADVATALSGLDAALVASEARQSEFLLSVSHELRTPLTTMRGYAEALADGVIAPTEVAGVGRTLVGESERMERYVGDLLALARLQAADFSLDLAPVDLTQLVVATAAAWDVRATRSGVRVSVAPGTEAAPVIARTDAGRVRQVLDALIDNAVRVCSPGDRVTLSVSNSVTRPGGTDPGAVLLQVTDTGPGLTADDARVAFEPGVLHDRYAGARPGGHGLGLAIAHRLVTRLGGTIRVQPAAGRGAEFVIALPTPPGP